MTAATFDGTLEGAPRASVEDAWRTLNTRYATGTAVLVAALALLWMLGMGPRSAPVDAPTAMSSTTLGPATEPAARATASPGGAVTATGAIPNSAARTADPAAAAGTIPNGTMRSGESSPAGGAAVDPNGPIRSSETSPAAVAGRPGASSASSAPGAAAAATPPSGGAAEAPGATASAALPRPVAGAPVARLYFEPDQAWPSGEVGKRLAPVIARLKAEPDTKALVSGYHDRRGPSVERNVALAKRRAQSVRKVLIREGIAADRIVLAKPQQTQGSGPDREARRVEVTVAR